MEVLSTEYKGISAGAQELGTLVPSQLANDTTHALEKLRDALGGDVSGFVAKRLHFSQKELFQALAMEQIDSVAMAIYNIEMRSQTVIIGDQTGIGKGRQAAAMIRYGMLSGYLPVFFTDRYTLFSDMYRDCKALGIQEARPLIVNSGVSVVDFDKVIEPESMPDAPDEIWSPTIGEDEEADDSGLMTLFQKQYEVVYKSLKKREMEIIYSKRDIPEGCYEYLMMTYSQLKDAKKDKTRLDFLNALCEKHRLLFIFDEAHRSSSVSAGNVSVITQCINSVLENSAEAQCVFLSATFAKRPECLITFMQRTALSALATKATLQLAFASGGVPMQEFVSSTLAAEGQMIRREHSNEGIPDPIYTYLDDDLVVHSELFDRVMYWFRELVTLSQMVHQAIALGRLYRLIADWGCYPTRGQLFYVNKILLIALKAKTIADAAVGEVRQGRSVVIGMSDTLECVLQDVVKDEKGNCSGDFSAILLRLLEKTVIDTHSYMSLFDLTFDMDLPGADEVATAIAEVETFYELLKHGIKEDTFQLPLSPIDVMRQLITRETFEAPDGRFIHIRFEECTGRVHQLEYTWPDGEDDFCAATIVSRRKVHSNRIFNDFQNNKLDVILINACGAIGASAHAIATAEVPESQVRQRKMLIVQTDLDVNIDLQKRGRINRTGQRMDLPPLYEYIITSIPSEKRLNMMLRAKLRLLSANIAANQDQDRKQADFIDLSNKYGNQVAREFLEAHTELSFVLGLKPTSSLTASRLMARLAMLSVTAQQDAIDELFTAYQTLETDLRRINQWDLEREHRDFEAVFVRDEFFTAALDDSRLGAGSYLTTYRCRHRTFPYDSKSLQKAIIEAQQQYGLPFRENSVLHKEVDAYYRLQRKKVRERIAQRQNILTLNVRESLKKHITNDELVDELIAIAQQPYESWCGMAKEKVKGLYMRNTILRRLKSYSNEWMAHAQRLGKNLKKISEEGKRLRTILSAAKLGFSYDMSGCVELEFECDHVIGVLKDIRFGQDIEKKFLPGKVELVFALSAGMREISINLVHSEKNSNYGKLEGIMKYGQPYPFDAMVWDKEIAKYNNRIIERKIVTGNILGAYSDPAIANLKPRFITFTLAPDKAGKKTVAHGLLMPLDEARLRDVLKNVTLPLADGLRYANSTSSVYYVTGLDVTFLLMPIREKSNDGLKFRISVDERSTKAFEQLDAPIRSLFIAEPVSSIRSERDKASNNPKQRKTRMRYHTDNLRFESETMQSIIAFWVKNKAMIVVPREQITIGELKQFESQSLHEENIAWPVLDWQNETEQPLPPSHREVLLHITPPILKDDDAGLDVQSYSPFVTLCKATLKLEGCSMKDMATRLQSKSLYFNWRSCSHLDDNERSLRRAVLDELRHALIEPTDKISLACYDRLYKASCKERLDVVTSIRERFKEEFLFMSPPREQVMEFLNNCPCSNRLEHLVHSLRRYLDGETDVIMD